MNKISNFEGDNDNVDEELESSGEKDKNSLQIDPISEEEEPHQSELSEEEEEESISQLDGLKMSLTYGDKGNMMSSGRADLAMKVVNVNGEGMLNQNPFTVNSPLNQIDQNQGRKVAKNGVVEMKYEEYESVGNNDKNYQTKPKTTEEGLLTIKNPSTI